MIFSGRSRLSQDANILTDGDKKEVFSYHSSIKLQHNEPILSLCCDVSEVLRPQEVIACCTPFRLLIWVRKGTGWRVAKVWTLEQLEAECILSCHISTCHKWIFIWSTVQCSTRLTAASVEYDRKLLKILWTTKYLFTNSQKHYSLMLSTSELIIGSVTPSDQTQLMKVTLSESNGTVIVDGDTKCNELDFAQDELISVIPIEGLHEALLGTTSSLLYIW
ncbi:hypothetical protein LSH36_127g06057 [Paralvinella palmiformis]|uniref:Uncharacterized protein n=1 Tax=Paralvinella palmiformis TaxID=53620 RepID=A0AAD9JWN5_9ANNE|nr:hypothetical protein LSH36_127g06057 [Paralvinella palmiformis]